MNALATYTGIAQGNQNAATSGELGPESGTVHNAPNLIPGQESATPPYPHGGTHAFAPSYVEDAGWMDHETGNTWTSKTPGQPVASLGAWLANASGSRHPSREIRPTAVYRQGDRTTLVGYAVDVAGQPLRQVRIQFIGETTQGLFSGAGSDLNGLVVAYLPTGDTYAAYAFSPTSGLTWRLLKITNHGPSVTFQFQRITRQAGYGEGIFMGGA